MKLKRINLLECSKLFVYLGNKMTVDKIRGVKMRYMLSKNNGEGNSIFGPEIKAIEGAGYAEFERKRVELVNKLGAKDKNGKMIIGTDGRVDIKDMADFEKQFNALKDDYKDLFIFLEEEVEINPHLIALNDIPNEIIEDQIIMDKLIPFIRE